MRWLTHTLPPHTPVNAKLGSPDSVIGRMERYGRKTEVTPHASRVRAQEREPENRTGISESFGIPTRSISKVIRNPVDEAQAVLGPVIVGEENMLRRNEA